VKTKTTLLLLTLILGACSAGTATPQALPAQIPTEASPPPTEATSSTQCGYQWAYQDLPDLTAQFDAMIKTLIPNSTSRATAYGENCIGNDGQIVRFSAMETDFYVLATVETLDDYETLGNWVYDVMQVVDGIPPEDLAGPQPGFVEFRFEKSASDSIGFRVPIQGFSETAGDKSGEELFRLFYTSP
jgi:hypothetical protein